MIKGDVPVSDIDVSRANAATARQSAHCHSGHKSSQQNDTYPEFGATDAIALWQITCRMVLRRTHVMTAGLARQPKCSEEIRHLATCETHGARPQLGTLMRA